MHRPAAASRAARGFAQDLGEKAFDGPAFGQVMAVGAVASPHRILAAERRANPRCDGFLTYVEMAGTAHLAGLDHAGDGLFDAPDQEDDAPARQPPVIVLPHER